MASEMMERYTSSMSKAPHRETHHVGIRQLRDHLSRWIDEVQQGGEVLVTERGRPVARIIKASGGSSMDELIEAGVVTTPQAPLDPASFGRVRTDGDVMEFVFQQRR
jgi:prevent-host-death family protein